MTKRILHLTLKKKWFDLIAKDLKKVEYRKLTSYWRKRFISHYTSGVPSAKTYDEVHFRNGYRKDSPFMRVEWRGLFLEKFDGEKATKELHFGIFLGKVLELKKEQ